ncbi:MAG TPA: hypothetical protein VKM54_08800 [Myxococcota bacterium]|nr:hypothetical protein [Myxococcota bacterium]
MKRARVGSILGTFVPRPDDAPLVLDIELGVRVSLIGRRPLRERIFVDNGSEFSGLGTHDVQPTETSTFFM